MEPFCGKMVVRNRGIGSADCVSKEATRWWLEAEDGAFDLVLNAGAGALLPAGCVCVAKLGPEALVPAG